MVHRPKIRSDMSMGRRWRRPSRCWITVIGELYQGRCRLAGLKYRHVYMRRMYSTCLFCNGPLGANERIEHFPVGSRLAFDSEKGRLWVVCVGCARWNLTP